MILYNYDSNVILAELCKQRTGEALAEAYKILHQRLVKSGVVPILQRLDNEASKIMIRAIEERKLEYQLASPHDHRLNPAERAIQTWKNHLSILQPIKGRRLGCAASVFACVYYGGISVHFCLVYSCRQLLNY